MSNISADYRPQSAANPQLNFQKYGFFAYFCKILNFLSSKSEFGPKLPQNHLKWFFWDSLDPKDYLDPFLDEFWKSEILIFLQFFQPYSVVWDKNQLTCIPQKAIFLKFNCGYFGRNWPMTGRLSSARAGLSQSLVRIFYIAQNPKLTILSTPICS